MLQMLVVRALTVVKCGHHSKSVRSFGSANVELLSIIGGSIMFYIMIQNACRLELTLRAVSVITSSCFCGCTCMYVRNCIVSV